MAAERLYKTVNVLLVEDSEADIRLTRETLKENKLKIDLEVVNDGIEAIAYLKKEGEYKGMKRPDLILLDLNLPKKDGREILAEIKSDSDLKSIPTVILTVSKDEEDILRTYELGANCFITKPVDLKQFTKVIDAIEDFWFDIVRLPLKEEKV